MLKHREGSQTMKQGNKGEMMLEKVIGIAKSLATHNKKSYWDIRLMQPKVQQRVVSSNIGSSPLMHKKSSKNC